MTLNLNKSTWKRVAFGDVVKSLNATVKDAEAAGIDRVIAMEHLDPGMLKISRWGSLEDGTTFTRRVRPGQTLFGKRRAYQRKAAYAEFEAITSGDILVFEADAAQLLPELLPFLVQGDAFYDHALGTSAGSLSPRTNWQDLANFEFDLPPLDEQKRLTDLLSAVEAMQEADRALLSSGQIAEVKLLQDAFHSDWPQETVAKLGDVQLGQQLHPKYRTGPNMRRYLRVANVGDNCLYLHDVASMDFSDPGAEKFRLEPGDLLLNEGQSIELVGRCAMFRGEIPNCHMQKTLLRFRSGPYVVPDFALAWFRRCFHLGHFAEVAKRTTSMAHLTAVRFSAMPMPCPPMAEQHRVIEQVESVGRMLAATRDELHATQRLRSSLLAEIFGGN